jgi:kanamycin kinase
LPHALASLADGRTKRTVWRNELGGLTFEVGAGSDRFFVKWAPVGSGLDLTAEEQRLVWAAPYVRVPAVLGSGHDDDGSWLMTAPVPGRSAVDPKWVAQPERAVHAIGIGLRQLHDRLPVETCPFSWSVADRLASVADPVAGRATPEIDRLVVCHGDPCSPNTMVADDGSVAGHVDFDALGVADRWADLAIATLASQWNYGPGWEDALLDAYGIAADRDRIDYYRWLWNLGG